MLFLIPWVLLASSSAFATSVSENPIHLATVDSASVTQGITLQDGTHRSVDLLFHDLNGEARTLDDWAGDLIVLNFWATWCPPCIREMPLFQSYHERFAERGLRIIAIAIDDPVPVARFVAERTLEFPILQGMENAASLAALLGNPVGALPFTVVIDQQSHLRIQHIGEVHPAQMDDWVQRFLEH